MDYEKLFGLILDLGRDLIRCGGETHRVEDTLYRLAAGYDYRECSIWVVPTLIQATFTDPNGVVRTQIRHVKGGGLNFNALDRLNALSRWACTEQPSAEAFAARLEQINSTPPPKLWILCLSEVLGGWGFSLIFGCDLWDSLIAAFASLIIFFLVRTLSRKEGNPLILNFAVSFVTEIFILCVCHFGPGSHMETITIGVVMLLISGLGAFNGLRDLVHLDTLSGLINLAASFTGAIGIALGMALPMMLFRSWNPAAVSMQDPNPWIQVVVCALACFGFSLLFCVPKGKIIFCALGASMTWGTFLLVHHFYPSIFAATMAASVFSGLYGQTIARIKKSPATIFSTICILPLLPGSALYYTMYGLITRNADLSYTKGVELGLICFGIVLGFMCVEVVNRFLWRRPR
ncbi:MAG: threonine/serine exporter family protein [Oscillospiraceae bacterium]|nr:threonine/serine exporter family protein [Oscillospiraceae bacterium]